MATGAVSRILRGPGRLVVTPTTAFATTAFPYGGTEVGLVKTAIVQAHGVPFRVESEALGEATDILEPNREYSVTFELRGWDDDAVSVLLAQSYVAGATSQHSVYRSPDEIPGGSAIGRAVILAYVPDDVLHVPGILIYRGITGWDEGSDITFDREEELILRLRVDCLRDGSGSMLKIGRLADLVLS